MIEGKKKKLIINKCNEMFKENPSTIIAVQETHFKENDVQGMAIECAGTLRKLKVSTKIKPHPKHFISRYTDWDLTIIKG